MTEQTRTTRQKLIEAAARLFQLSGIAGTSVADILAEASVPKGSLYHHFPDGKNDLAAAAADMASEVILDIIARAYAPAEDFETGTGRLAEKFARLFERYPHWRACPVQWLLIDGQGGDAARAHRVLDRWIAAIAGEASRLGHPAPEAAARRLWTVLIGAWTLARTSSDASVLRDMPALLDGLGSAPISPP